MITQEQLDVLRSNAYDTLDRYFRNSLDDDDYAMMSRDLDILFAYTELTLIGEVSGHSGSLGDILIIKLYDVLPPVGTKLYIKKET